MLVQYSLLPTVYICDFLFVCLLAVSLTTCGQSVYLWSVCLLVVSLSTCGQSVYLWSVCLLVVSLSTCGQSVYLWSVCLLVVSLLVMMAEKDHHCTEPNHRAKLRCEVTMQSLKTRSKAAKLRCGVEKLRCKVTKLRRCELTMQSYDAKLGCKVTMQSYDAKFK